MDTNKVRFIIQDCGDGSVNTHNVTDEVSITFKHEPSSQEVDAFRELLSSLYSDNMCIVYTEEEYADMLREAYGLEDPASVVVS